MADEAEMRLSAQERAKIAGYVNVKPVLGWDRTRKVIAALLADLEEAERERDEARAALENLREVWNKELSDHYREICGGLQGQLDAERSRADALAAALREADEWGFRCDSSCVSQPPWDQSRCDCGVDKVEAHVKEALAAHDARRKGEGTHEEVAQHGR